MGWHTEKEVGQVSFSSCSQVGSQVMRMSPFKGPSPNKLLMEKEKKKSYVVADGFRASFLLLLITTST